MFSKIFLYLKKIDLVLFFSFLFLSAIGLLGIYSVETGQSNSLDNFYKQIFFLSIGLLVFFVFLFFNFSALSNYSVYIYSACLLVLFLVLVFGSEINGTKGWFNFGFFNLQPIEFVKIGLILFLAKYFSSVPVLVNQKKYLFISWIFVFLLIALILFQPDLGSAFIILFIWFFLLFIVGFSKKYFLIIFSCFLLLSFFAWQFYLKDYQKQRITSFLLPVSNNINHDYNVKQAIISVGAGGLFGRGFGFGTQSQLKFLPEARTDFIFAVIAEELGFLGIFLVLFFFGLIFYRIFSILYKIKDENAFYFCFSVAGLIFIEMFINIGMNIGLFPVIGIALPFLSYGGSSLVSNLIIMGILQNIIIKSKIK